MVDYLYSYTAATQVSNTHAASQSKLHKEIAISLLEVLREQKERAYFKLGNLLLNRLPNLKYPLCFCSRHTSNRLIVCTSITQDWGLVHRRCIKLSPTFTQLRTTSSLQSPTCIIWWKIREVTPKSSQFIIIFVPFTHKSLCTDINPISKLKMHTTHQ